ncbi:MFS general substrate transporter [Violaceomyces palustris]|uniref:MFS general substrate transporter n=1 Tax=Violaceomyces palustris TaxID=1673888 RepID=A0ACD0NT14_9BASI|nr:MFS general substrate transporter [Violaceomyces palustris]
METKKDEKSYDDLQGGGIQDGSVGDPEGTPGFPPLNRATITNEDYKSEEEREREGVSKMTATVSNPYPNGIPFRWSSLWKKAEVNPINNKSLTFNLLRLGDYYANTFWLATLGFFVAFLSWFAFSPLVPEAVKKDLKLSGDQVINSNMASLGGTALVRIIAGPACDKFGPRKVLATLLILGAIPSGLAALVKNIHGLEAVRFFISILGGTFVPTQAWCTLSFDKSVVGTANAFAGGWGNLGGGVTVAAMIGLYERFVKAGFSSSKAWRLCFPTLPVPCLLLVAAMILLFGRDHPNGKWSQRFDSVPPILKEDAEAAVSSSSVLSNDEKVSSSSVERDPHPPKSIVTSNVDTAQPQPLTLKNLRAILTDPRVWMVAICYLITFGLETALDASLPGLLTTIFQSPTFTVVDAAYAASTYGLLNIYARPLGGVVADMLYSKFGLRAKVLWLLSTAFLQGVFLLGLGYYVDSGSPKLGPVMAFIVLIANFGFMANGAAYAVYGHLRPANIGTVAGIVGSSGNLGGLCYIAVAKMYPGTRAANNLGKKFWIMGYMNVAAIAPFFVYQSFVEWR